ncbi:MAG: hypothetical protein HY907_16250 [Deltaproteobacteria bacterium]|nr:hypothetical protein [Deltaproteobacteria bacterium]
MTTRMTAAEIQFAYPDEWVVATDLPAPHAALPREGVVVFHSPNRSAALNAFGAAPKPAALWYVAPPALPNQ